MWKKIHRRIPPALRGPLSCVGILGAATLTCALLRPASGSDAYVPLIFVLAVLLVSLSTDGRLWGTAASLVAVVEVNVVFTRPYFQMDFSPTGYPLTFLCMLAVSLIASTLVSRVREGERIRREADRAALRADLLRAVSHDFRTPLTSVIGATTAVLENGDRLSEAEKTALLKDVRDEAERLYQMVENVLSVTRIGADEVLHERPELVEEVVGEAVSRFRRWYPDLRVETRLPDGILFADMDAMLIEQVLIDLLINVAVHAKGATKAVVSVEAAQGEAVFRVEDDGAGIAKELLPHLFDGTAPRGEGMGIGLSVCRAIVTAHGGTMRVESPPGGGARSTFTLPAREEDAPWD